MKRQFYIGIAASIFCLSQLSNIDIAQAQLDCQSVADGCLKINTDALQIPVVVSDIDSQNTVQKVAEGSGLTGASFTPANKQIIRTINNLWQLEVASGTENNFTANYQCNNQSSAIQLSIEPIPITPVGPSSSNPDKVVIQGGAKFKIDLNNTQASGNYSCDLHIDVIEQL